MPDKRWTVREAAPWIVLDENGNEVANCLVGTTSEAIAKVTAADIVQAKNRGEKAERLAEAAHGVLRNGTPQDGRRCSVVQEFKLNIMGDALAAFREEG